MQKQKLIFLSFLILFSSNTFSEIVSHKSMTAVSDYIACQSHDFSDIIVIFDIDNTIAHPKKEVGSDQWLEYKAKEQAIDGVTISQAYQELLPLYYKIQHVIDLALVEDMIPDLIAQLKKSGIATLGLTARSNPIIDRTFTQLEPLGVSFSELIDQEIAIESALHDSFYKKGIVFCGNNNKGEVLFNFFKKNNLKFKKIFCIDDKMHHLAKVEKAAIENGVECTCIHYTQCQERVENFNPEQAEKELLELDI